MADPCPTFAAFSERWLQRLQPPAVKPKTHRNYAQALRLWVLPVLGDVPLDRITRGDLESLVAGLREAGKSPGTTKQAYATLRAMLTDAQDDGVLAQNVARGAGRAIRRHLRGRGPRPPMALNAEDLAHFLCVVERELPAFFVLFLFLARTGVRHGEALALRWEHVDLERRGALIVDTWDGKDVEIVKTEEPRYVDLSRDLVTALRRHQLRTRGAFCFPSSQPSKAGRPWGQAWIVETMHRACALAGLSPRLTPHHLRHTVGSHLLHRHAPLAYVQRLLGHRDPSRTMQYGSHLPNAAPEFVDRLDG